MATMYKTTVQVNKDHVNVVKAERDIFRRLLDVRDSGREVDIGSILKYELSPVPHKSKIEHNNQRWSCQHPHIIHVH